MLKQMGNTHSRDEVINSTLGTLVASCAQPSDMLSQMCDLYLAPEHSRTLHRLRRLATQPMSPNVRSELVVHRLSLSLDDSILMPSAGLLLRVDAPLVEHRCRASLRRQGQGRRGHERPCASPLPLFLRSELTSAQAKFTGGDRIIVDLHALHGVEDPYPKEVVASRPHSQYRVFGYGTRECVPLFSLHSTRLTLAQASPSRLSSRSLPS